MKKIYTTIEYTDGAVHENIRIYAADKIAAAKTARLNDIPWVEGPEAHSLLAYQAARRAGITSADNYDDWMATVADFELSTEDTHAEDPTPPTA